MNVLRPLHQLARADDNIEILQAERVSQSGKAYKIVFLGLGVGDSGVLIFCEIVELYWTHAEMPILAIVLKKQFFDAIFLVIVFVIIFVL